MVLCDYCFFINKNIEFQSIYLKCKRKLNSVLILQYKMITIFEL